MKIWLTKWVLFLSIVSVSCSGRTVVTPEGEKLVGKRFVVEKPLFVLQYIAFDHPLVEPPGHSSHAPPSIELYERNPTNWMDLMTARRAGVTVDRNEVEVLGVIQPGTVVQVTGYEITRSFIGDILAPLGRVDASQYSNLEVEFFCLFEGLGGSDPDPRPNPEYLRAARD